MGASGKSTDERNGAGMAMMAAGQETPSAGDSEDGHAKCAGREMEQLGANTLRNQKKTRSLPQVPPPQLLDAGGMGHSGEDRRRAAAIEHMREKAAGKGQREPVEFGTGETNPRNRWPRGATSKEPPHQPTNAALVGDVGQQAAQTRRGTAGATATGAATSAVR